ncbi:MAG: hypothetical protein ACO3AY_05820 [Chitinophagaceae bacterium]
MFKQKLTFYFFITTLSFLISCKKEFSKAATIDSVKATLTNGLTKKWELAKFYIDGVEQSLTTGQSRYSKIYKINDTWLDSDGSIGSYNFTSPSTFTEITTNYFSGSRTLLYTIKECSITTLDVEYSISAVTYRLIFTI